MPPVLIVCATDQALDLLLEGVGVVLLRFGANSDLLRVRLGCSSVEMQ